MILYYAIGGGLGHLTRARAVLHTLSIKDRVVILASSPAARDPRVAGDGEVIAAPEELSGDPEMYRRWLSDLIERSGPSAIFLDTFPAGILGEFCGFAFPRKTSLFQIARLLRWPQYSRQICGPPPSFTVTYVIEPLAAGHEAFLRSCSLELRDLALKSAFRKPAGEVKEAAVRLMEERKPLWIIVHSGPDREILELVSYAGEMSSVERADPRLILISPHRPVALPDYITHLDLYPASSLYSAADRIITACGFNSMNETEAYREKHRFYPFARRFDDQFLRAARRNRRNHFA